MAKYIQTQTRKIISSYGGVGSIIETPKGALIIEPFDRWPFFQKEKHLEKENHIEDNRLLKRLQFEKGFPKLKFFVKIPNNVSSFKNPNIPQNSDNVLRAKYFPEWFYCNRCKRFHKISDWWNGWKNTLQKYKKEIRNVRSLFYETPKCYHCFDEIQKTKKKQNPFIELEQIRFILTASNGEIEDIPWERWNTVQKKVKDKDSDNGTIIFDFDNLCCNNQDLQYIKSEKFSDLAGIRIQCKNCGKKQTLSGIFGLRLPVFQEESDDSSNQRFKKPVIRTSNSVYYPILISSIYLPTELAIKPDDAKEIDEWLGENEAIELIVKIFKKRGYSKEKIIRYIKNKQLPEFEPEIEYRLKEYNFLINPERIVYPINDDIESNLIFEKQKISRLQTFYFDNLIKMKKLKLTVVQTGYTRQEPMDKDQFLSGDFANIKPKYTSKWTNQTEYLPAIENYGEGIFINFNKKKISGWVDLVLNDPIFSARIKTIQENSSSNELIVEDRFEDIRFLSKFILLHTLSHILIKEFEFSVGYPATSLNERLYIDNNEMSGLLIYTVAGAEGSYGGLISQANEENFIKIFQSALYRAKDCASDPICYNSYDGQGIGGLNMAACYSCAIIPDISCEEFNSFLDRALLIDKDFGFFSNDI